MLANVTKHSTKFGKLDQAELVEKGRAEIERLARECKAAGALHCEHNLAVLRAAWKLAEPVSAEVRAAAVARATAAVKAAWGADLNAAERRLGGEGSNGNFDLV